MKATRAMLLATTLSACASGPTPTPDGPVSAQENDAATPGVRAQVERTMAAFVAMDLDGFTAGLAEDVTAFEMDLDGKPVRLGARDEVVQYAREMFAQLKQMGASVKLDIHVNDCRANATLAYCTVEFDLKATMADGSTISQPSRNSVVLHKGNNGWQWTHWHSSLAVLPAPSVP